MARLNGVDTTGTTQIVRLHLTRANTRICRTLIGEIRPQSSRVALRRRVTVLSAPCTYTPYCSDVSPTHRNDTRICDRRVCATVRSVSTTPCTKQLRCCRQEFCVCTLVSILFTPHTYLNTVPSLHVTVIDCRSRVSTVSIDDNGTL